MKINALPKPTKLLFNWNCMSFPFVISEISDAFKMACKWPLYCVLGQSILNTKWLNGFRLTISQQFWRARGRVTFSYNATMQKLIAESPKNGNDFFLIVFGKFNALVTRNESLGMDFLDIEISIGKMVYNLILRITSISMHVCWWHHVTRKIFNKYL